MRIVPLRSSRVETYAVYDNHEMLCGLINHIPDEGRWKIQLNRKFTHFESTKEQAMAWTRGAWCVLDELEKQAVVALAQRRNALRPTGGSRE